MWPFNKQTKKEEQKEKEINISYFDIRKILTYAIQNYTRKVFASFDWNISVEIHHDDYSRWFDDAEKIFVTFKNGEWQETATLYGYDIEKARDIMLSLIKQGIDVYATYNDDKVLEPFKTVIDGKLPLIMHDYVEWKKLKEKEKALLDLNLSDYKIGWTNVHDNIDGYSCNGYHIFTTFKKAVVYLSFLEDKKYFDEYKQYVFERFKNQSNEKVITADEPSAEFKSYETWLDMRDFWLKQKKEKEDFETKLNSRCARLEQYLKEVNR